MGNTNQSFYNARLPAQTSIRLLDDSTLDENGTNLFADKYYVCENETPVSLPNGCHVKSNQGRIYAIMNGNTAIDYNPNKSHRKIYFKIKGGKKLSYLSYADCTMKKMTFRVDGCQYGKIQHAKNTKGTQLEYPVNLEIGTILRSVDSSGLIILLTPENINFFTFTLVTSYAQC